MNHKVAEKVTHKKSWFEKAFPFLYKKKVPREFPKHLVPRTDEPRLQSLGNKFWKHIKMFQFTLLLRWMEQVVFLFGTKRNFL